MKHRVIQDLRFNMVNGASATWERSVLPRPVDHGLDMPQLSVEGRGLASLILDWQDAFMRVPLDANEQAFNCAAVPGLFGNPDSTDFIIWGVLGFGGKANPLVFSRTGSFANRSAQALWDTTKSRLHFVWSTPP